MVLEISVPGLGDKPKNAKDAVVSLLSREYPLSVKAISLKIRKKYGISVTFQAVYKVVNQLLDEGVLVKEGKEVAINKNWIVNLKAFTDGLQRKYFEDVKSKEKIIATDDIKVYSFRSVLEKDKFWCKLHEKWVLENGRVDKRPTAWWGAHCWWVLAQLDNEDALVKQIKKHGCQMFWLNSGATFLDKWSKHYYQGKGLHYRSGVKNADHSVYIMAIGDYVFESRYPKELVKELEKFYNGVRNIRDMNLGKLMDILKKEREIKMTVIKNKILANQLRKEILKKF